MLPDKHLDSRCCHRSFLGEELGCRQVEAVVDMVPAGRIVDHHMLAEEDMVAGSHLAGAGSLEEDLDCSILGLTF